MQFKCSMDALSVERTGTRPTILHLMAKVDKTPTTVDHFIQSKLPPKNSHTNTLRRSTNQCAMVAIACLPTTALIGLKSSWASCLCFLSDDRKK